MAPRQTEELTIARPAGSTSANAAARNAEMTPIILLRYWMPAELPRARGRPVLEQMFEKYDERAPTRARAACSFAHSRKRLRTSSHARAGGLVKRKRRQNTTLPKSPHLVRGLPAAAAFAGCGETQIVTETKIQEVIREVPVERIVTKIVKEEVAVEVERIVTQEVERVVTQIVEKERIVEKIVTVEAMAPKPENVEIIYWTWLAPQLSRQQRGWARRL